MKSIAKKIAVFFLGLFVLLMGLELSLRTVSLINGYFQKRGAEKVLASNPFETRVLVVGESTTAVAGEESGRLLVSRTSYPAQLEEILNQRQASTHYRVMNGGVMAGTTSLILRELPKQLSDFKPHVVVAMMGLKDRPSSGGQKARPLKLQQLAYWASETFSLQYYFGGEKEQKSSANSRAQSAWLTKLIREPRMLVAFQEHGEELRMKLSAALYSWGNGRYGASETLLKEIRERYDVGYYFSARLLSAMERPMEAETLLKEALRRFPSEGMYAAGLAELYAETGKNKDASAWLAQIDRDLDHYEFPELVANFRHYICANLALRTGDYKKAHTELADLNAGLELGALETFFPSFEMLTEGLEGEILFREGRLEEAARKLTLVTTRFPEDASYLWLLGEVLRQQGKFEEENDLRRRVIAQLGDEVRLADYYEYFKLMKLMGKRGQTDLLFKEAVSKIPSLKNNFRKLAALTKANGARLIIMQYPSFGTDILKMYAPDGDGISVVDNEHLFDESPEKYFYEPRYPYSFSHFTKAGARRLAERLADEVLGIMSGPRVSAAEGER